MKKIAGTLKLDQAQFREMEAFAKFGSDLDKATQLIIDRGRRNQEILKQPQYSPIPVEQQIAIIFVSTKGILDKVPLDRVKEFEREYISELTANHSDTLESLKSSSIDDEVSEKLREVANKIVKNYQN
jgi:F-type H+-transporting ATPase subunit alpha